MSNTHKNRKRQRLSSAMFSQHDEPPKKRARLNRAEMIEEENRQRFMSDRFGNIHRCTPEETVDRKIKSNKKAIADKSRQEKKA